MEEPLTQPPKPVETQFSTAITHRPEILFVKSRRNGEVRCLEEIARIPPDMRLRTAAHLVRGRDYPNVLAASGYAGEWWRFTTANMLWHPPDLLDNVKTLMEEVNHEIIWDPKARWARPGDAESRKNYYACHAEKQLITYFVRKHVITPKDRERLYPISRKQEKLDDASKEAKSEPTASPSMVKALDLPLPSGSLTSATITVSREMCLDWR